MIDWLQAWSNIDFNAIPSTKNRKYIHNMRLEIGS